MCGWFITDDNLERVVTDEELSNSDNQIDSEDESTSKPNTQPITDNIEQNDDVTTANFSAGDEHEQRYDNDEMNTDTTDVNTENENNEKQELNIDMDNDNLIMMRMLIWIMSIINKLIILR